ncbi:MAG TPA: MBL fold metallo-hydrolase [bacterium]|nr:MBL fold metallo-hydrolase [bacterium]
MRLQFLGATETVTGSKFHLAQNGNSWLIDCGLYQGLKELRRRNWNPLPVDVKKIEKVILTHAHIDHSGYLPLLVKDGFKGKAVASEPTVELCKILLPDAGYIQEEDAKFAAKKGFSRHEHPMALYTYADAVASLSCLESIPDRTWVDLSHEVRIMLRPAGHILGSRLINVSVKEKHHKFNIMFAGDIGGYDALISVDPGAVKSVTYLVLESTYGNRLHKEEDILDRFEGIINRTVGRGGKVIIPAFAVGRTQEVLFALRKLEDQGRLPDIPIYLNSPLAIDATAIYIKYASEHNFFKDVAEPKKAFHPSRLVYVHDAEESKHLNALAEPAIIISSSGMMTGGRILHHLKAYLPDPKSTLVITGFQAAGTRGRSIVDGAKAVKIHGMPVAVNAELEFIESLSAHGDWGDILRWLKGFTQPPKATFLVHGESEAAAALRERIEKELGWKVVVPKYLEKYEL